MDLVEQYLSYLAVEKGLRPRSLSAYRRDLTDFVAWLDDKGRSPIGPGIDGALVLYQVSMHDRGLNGRSIARKLSAIRGLYRFLVREGQIASDPSLVLEAPKAGRPLPDVLTLAEVEALLGSPDSHEPLGMRDRAMLELMYAAGLRESETIDLTIGDLNRPAEYLMVRGKGGRERVVPVGQAALAALDLYLAKGRPQIAHDITSRLLFLNARGGKLSRMGLWKIVRHHALRAGLRPGVHPHMIRHSCATHMLENGASIRVVQEFLGHVDIATTQIYTHLTTQQLKEIHARTHPRG